MSTESVIAERKARWRRFLAEENPPRHLFPAGARLIAEVTAPTQPEAQRRAERLAVAYRRA